MPLPLPLLHCTKGKKSEEKRVKSEGGIVKINADRLFCSEAFNYKSVCLWRFTGAWARCEMLCPGFTSIFTIHSSNFLSSTLNSPPPRKHSQVSSIPTIPQLLDKLV